MESPSCQKELLENVQKRATKLFPGLSELSYPDRLRKLNLPTLAYRHVRGDMIQVYKMTCKTGGYDNTFPSILTAEAKNDLRGHSKKLSTKRFNNVIGKYFFSHHIMRLWNSLPKSAVKADDIIAFERELDWYWENQQLKYDNFKAEIKTTALHLSNYL